MEKQRINVIDAAKIMGVMPQFIRIGLQNERLPFGCAVKTSKGKWTYHISPKLFYDYVGQAKEV